jgi:hypothetical protein
VARYFRSKTRRVGLGALRPNIFFLKCLPNKFFLNEKKSFQRGLESKQMQFFWAKKLFFSGGQHVKKKKNGRVGGAAHPLCKA